VNGDSKLNIQIKASFEIRVESSWASVVIKASLEIRIESNWASEQSGTGGNFDRRLREAVDP
jgi:hypothetical protein